MLKRSKAWRCANQQGTVLLTVVIMVMVLFTLTSICLDVIHHSTRVSSRNVQKTQAKLTAERVLTEFIEGYKNGKIAADNTLNAETAFGDLQKAAQGKTQEKPLVYVVGMRNSSTATPQSDFDQNYGHTEIHIYETGKGFNVESICTYSTQTQTASCIFEGSVTTPYIPSNTIESQRGKLVDDKQLTVDAKGSVWIEKGKGSSGYKKLSRTNSDGTGNACHYYVQHNVRLDDKWTTTDVENHVQLQSYDASVGGMVDNVEYKVSGFGFKQAPTVTCDGYFANQNSVNGVYTEVGKIDANKVSPTVGTGGGYDKTNLGNFDGYVRVDKKMLVTKPDGFKLGSDKGDIDLYAHGMVVGPFPDGKIEGAHDFHAEATTVKGIYENYLQSAVSATMDVYGNVYIYKGADEESQDGSLAITCNAQLNVRGDVFVEGNIYFLGQGAKLQCNNLYCSGRIYVDNNNTYNPDGTTNFVTVTPDKDNWWSLDDSGNFYKKGAATADASSGAEGRITINGSSGALTGAAKKAHIKKTIDTTVQRNKYPEDGFDPMTGKTSATRPNLDSIYGPCSANDMFTMTVADGTSKDAKLKAAADNLSGKYADAMNRYFTTSPTDGSVTYTSTYKDSKGNTKPVVEHIGNTSTNMESADRFYRINASVKLTQSQANLDKSVVLGYVIDLRDEDIIICLPIGHTGSTDGDIGAKFRVDTRNRVLHTNPSDDAFVYFMFYDPTQMKGITYYDPDIEENVTIDRDGCLYYSGNGTTLNATLTGDTGSYQVTGIGKKDADSTGSGIGHIFFGNMAKQQAGTLVGNLETVDKNNVYDPTATVSEQVAKLSANFRYNGFKNNELMNNTIMYLIPNDVGIGFSTHHGKTNFDDFGGSSGAWYAQGLIYGVRSHVKINAQEDGGGLFGQVKGYEVSFYGDNKTPTIDCPIEDGSLLNYVKAANASVAVVKLQYYLY